MTKIDKVLNQFGNQCYLKRCAWMISSRCCKVVTSGTGEKSRNTELINFQNHNKNERENMINGKGIHLLFYGRLHLNKISFCYYWQKSTSNDQLLIKVQESYRRHWNDITSKTKSISFSVHILNAFVCVCVCVNMYEIHSTNNMRYQMKCVWYPV